MTREQILGAIVRSRPGIAKYLDISSQFLVTDVSKDRGFQRLFNSFYRVRQRPAYWYAAYYEHMQGLKGTNPKFSTVLNSIFVATGRYEPSFSSKLLATVNKNLPIWDSRILKRLQIRPPSYNSRRKLEEAVGVYGGIQEWYLTFMKTPACEAMLEIFNESVPEHMTISDVKKIDFILWQGEPNQAL